MFDPKEGHTVLGHPVHSPFRHCSPQFVITYIVRRDDLRSKSPFFPMKTIPNRCDVVLKG